MVGVRGSEVKPISHSSLTTYRVFLKDSFVRLLRGSLEQSGMSGGGNCPLAVREGGKCEVRTLFVGHTSCKV